MLLREFDTIRDNYPEEGADLQVLEQAFVSALTSDRAAVLDVPSLAARAGLGEERTKLLMVQLFGAGAIVPRYFFLCPRVHAESAEANSIGEFPLDITCPKCGEVHQFSVNEVVVGFIASPRLLSQLAR